MRSRRLGSALRRLREVARLDQQQAAEYIAGSKAKVSRIESGQVAARPGDVRLLLELYGIQDPETFRHYEQLARDANKRGWWLDYRVSPELSDYIALEHDATFVRTWQTVLVPGLLQTADYTRTLVESNPSVTEPDVVEQAVKMRQERRRRFEESGARYSAVVWEPALSDPMPSPEVHRNQLANLLETAARPNVTFQVLPTTEWAAARSAPTFVMLSFDGEWSPSAVGQETHRNVAITEDETEIAAYAHSFDQLRSVALNPADSQGFIADTLAAIAEESQ
ncbi:helix-turn-helix transcriptional regulator [Streptomyces sp. WMMB303]|uniref:helix-turn-helix domain-containing protein n=1 Tax=unclassified Streptomyces TaxID=2593676 RepID=UPI0023ED9B96|nr:helix-turn-helix transcriptional regulator [Streptomyces sp. WMMB303]MDF4250547.1 helix-turn-helix transcriptional regulator [Streptomyces sp. WMMB303]